MPKIPPKEKPTLSSAQAKDLLSKVRLRGIDMQRDVAISEARFETWKTSAADIVAKAFGANGDHWGKFLNAGVRMQIRMDGPDPQQDQIERANELEEKLQHLTALIDELDFRAHEMEDHGGAPISTSPSGVDTGPNKNVFIVHGHDETNLLKLENMLRDELGLSPVVLRDQANRGRHLLTKFTDEALKCSFAFVLVTPDDVVRTAKGEYAQARPNVIFELGWFWGRFGQKNVVVLLKDGAEIFSDFDGIATIRFSGEVTDKFLAIKRELVAVGIL